MTAGSPVWKGMKDSSLLNWPSSVRNLSGLKRSGSCHCLGSICTAHCSGNIMAPFGMWYPARVEAYNETKGGRAQVKKFPTKGSNICKILILCAVVLYTEHDYRHNQNYMIWTHFFMFMVPCIIIYSMKQPTDAALCSQFYSTARFTLHFSGVLHTHHQEYNF